MSIRWSTKVEKKSTVENVLRHGGKDGREYFVFDGRRFGIVFVRHACHE